MSAEKKQALEQLLQDATKGADVRKKALDDLLKNAKEVTVCPEKTECLADADCEKARKAACGDDKSCNLDERVKELIAEAAVAVKAAQDAQNELEAERATALTAQNVTDKRKTQQQTPRERVEGQRILNNDSDQSGQSTETRANATPPPGGAPPGEAPPNNGSGRGGGGGGGGGGAGGPPAPPKPPMPPGPPPPGGGAPPPAPPGGGAPPPPPMPGGPSHVDQGGSNNRPCGPDEKSTAAAPCTPQVPAGPRGPPGPPGPPPGPPVPGGGPGGSPKPKTQPAAKNAKKFKANGGGDGGGALLAAIRGHATVVTVTTDAATWEARRARAEALSKKVTTANPKGASANQIEKYGSIHVMYLELDKLIRTEFKKDTPDDERTAHWATTEKAYAVFLRDTLFGLTGRKPSEQFGKGVSAKDVNTLEQYAKSYLGGTQVAMPVATSVATSGNAGKGSMMEQMLAIQANLGKGKKGNKGKIGKGGAASGVKNDSAVQEHSDTTEGGVGQATQGAQRKLTAEEQLQADADAKKAKAQAVEDTQQESTAGDFQPTTTDTARWATHRKVEITVNVDDKDQTFPNVKVGPLKAWHKGKITDSLLHRLRILVALQYKDHSELVPTYLIAKKGASWVVVTQEFTEPTKDADKRTALVKHFDDLNKVWDSAAVLLNTWAVDQPTESWAKAWTKLKRINPVDAWKTARATYDDDVAVATQKRRTADKERVKNAAATKFTKAITEGVVRLDLALNVFVDAALAQLQVQAKGGWSDEDYDDEEDDDDVEGGSDTDEQEEGGGGKPLVLYEPSVRRVLMSMLLEDERASAATCADRFCRQDFSRCRLPCCPADRRLLGRCAEAELRELVYALHPLLRRAW